MFSVSMKLAVAAVFILGAEVQVEGAPPERKPASDQYGDPLPPHAVARLGTLRFRGINGVTQAAAVPGGKQILAVGHEPTVILWDAITGKEVRRFEGPSQRPARKEDGVPFHHVTFGSFAVSPDGKSVAAATVDGSGLECPILLFDLATGRKLAEWPGHRYSGYNGYPLLAFVTPTVLVSVSYDDSVRVWDATRQQELCRLALPAKSHVSAVVPSPNRKHVFVAGWNDKDKAFWAAWEAATGKLVHQEKDLPGFFSKLAVSPDGRSLALAMGTGKPPREPNCTEMRLYSVSDWKEQRRWQAHQGDDAGRCSIAFSPDGKTIATGGADGKVRRWDVTTGNEIEPVIDPWQRYSQNVVYLDNDTLLTFGWQQTVKLWDAKTSQPKRQFVGSEQQVSALAYAPDGRHVALGGSDAPIRVWDVASGQPVALLGQSESGVKAEQGITCLYFSPDGKWLLSGGWDGRARLWDWAKHTTPIRDFADDASPLHSLAFSPDGKSLATGDQAGVVRTWDVSTGKRVRTLKGQAFKGFSSRVDALVFTGDGQALFSSDAGHGVRHWNLATGKEIRLIGPGASCPPKPLASGVNGLAISPGNRWGYSSSNDGSIRVWETGSGQLARILKEKEPDNNGPVRIALSSDGTRLAAVTRWEDNPSVQLWDLTTGQKIAALTGHRAPVTALAFFPDGRRLVSGSCDTTALVWDLTKLGSGAKPPDGKALAGLWQELGSADSKVAYTAVCQGSASGDAAVDRLKLQFKPAVVIDVATIAALIRQLDSDEFAQREKASEALARLDPAAEIPLRTALEKVSNPDIMRRLEGILEGYDAEHRRLGNAVEVLEMIGTPAARRLLADLAKGDRDARLTRDARLALDRLGKRP